MHPKLVLFGNVLLDFTFSVEKNPELLVKYGFAPNGLGELSTNVLANVVKDAERTCDYISSQPGGSAMNTSKMLAQLGETELVFCGAIGSDVNANTVRQYLEKIHLNACLQTFAAYSTGTCVCLINRENRCCYANIGASILFEVEFLRSQNIIDLSGHKQIFYIEGFFITGSRFSICKYIIDDVCHSSNGSRVLAVNLSAEYLIDNNPDQMKYLAENATIIFGNKGEFNKLSAIYDMSGARDIISHLMKSVTKDKIIICTQGSGSVLYSSKSQNVLNEEFRFDAVPKETIVDTTGCGDAFVAGFFHAFLRNEAIDKCVASGVEVAKKKITAVGGTFLK